MKIEKTIRFLIIILFPSLIHCNPNSFKTHTLNPSTSFDSISDTIYISNINSMESYDKEIYLNEPKIGKIFVLDNEFKLIRDIGSLGLGPGELSSATRIRIKDDLLFVHNRGYSSISKFSIHGEFEGSIKLPIRSNDFIVSNEDQFFLPNYSLEDSINTKIKKVNSDGDIIYSFGAYRELDTKLPGSRIQKLAFDNSDNIISVFTSEPLVEKYTKDGQLIDQINLRNIKSLKKYWQNFDKKKIEAASGNLMVVAFPDIYSSGEHLFLPTSFGDSFATIIILELSNNIKPVMLLRVKGDEVNDQVWPLSLCVTNNSQLVLYEAFKGKVYIYDLSGIEL